tara:strand:- start:182 stop:505 length:324 start_codon:yes stop_codon:yes gene_type:complete
VPLLQAHGSRDIDGSGVMPGITANLTPEAFAIWNEIPKKDRLPREQVNPKPWKQGRSKWISYVIIEHKNWSSNYNAVIKEKFELEDKLRMMTNARDVLQEFVLAQDL